jgi:U3 small nucleolar RNA-associated protein 3
MMCSDELKAWGSRRKNYYDRDDDMDDEEVAKAEEAEALRLQKKRMETMTDEDFLEDGFDDSFSSRLKSGDSGKGVADLDELDSSEADTGFEKLGDEARKEALLKMPPEELQRHMKARIPEIEKYLGELLERWGEVADVLGPALKWMDVDQLKALPPGPAKDYLMLKYRE